MPPGAAGRPFYRSRTNRAIAGVCGGIAEYFGSDPGMVRLLAFILDVLTGIFPLLVLYLIVAIVVPEGPPTESPVGMPGGPGPGLAGGVGGPQYTARGADSGSVALALGGVLIVVGLLAFISRLVDIRWDLLWPVALVTLGVVLIVASQRR